MPLSAVPPGPFTAADVERLSIPDKQVELVRGHLVVREPPGTRHGAIAARLAYYLSAFVLPRRLGIVFAQDTGFQIERDPDTVLAPDVAFVNREREADIPARGYARLAPDIAVEVLSPDDRPGTVRAKIADWLGAGTRLVWVVDPHRCTVRVHRRDGTTSLLTAEDSIDGEELLPGFSCPVRDVLL